MTGTDPRRDARVRVRSTDVPAGPSPGEGTAPRGGAASGTARAGEPDDAATAYTRGLVRAQLRLGLACVASFLAVVTLLTVTMSGVPALDDVVVLGVPLPWLVHAYGFYPVIVAFAVVFAVAAARNERRYRALAEGAAPDEPGPDDGGAP
ncbi:heavy metal transporter [Cellulosimicrobium cellulans]|uniref:heavy metal transporter n=1 Tax=Cellulosimicrobium cellulans TaxID=1710 RepID=UPI0020CD46EB|nr:heavy metal transporter [Cellulosimicrobium cellulans]